MSLICILSQQQFGIHPWTEVPFWALWDSAPYTQGTGEISLTLVTSNRVTDPRCSCGPCSSYNLAPAPLGSSLEAPGECGLGESAMSERAFVKVLVSRGEVLGHH